MGPVGTGDWGLGLGLDNCPTIQGTYLNDRQIIFRERENHSAHLASIEAELDSQVAKVEAAARRQAQQDFEAERRAMQEKMEAEVTELQTHLRSVRAYLLSIT